MAFDFGYKRTGIAVTDPLQIISTGLKTVETKKLMEFIEDYLKVEPVEAFVFGLSLQLDGTENSIQKKTTEFANKLAKKYPQINIHWEDERYTSKDAMQTLILSGVPKMKRRNKALLDEVSATLILQTFMETYKK